MQQQGLQTCCVLTQVPLDAASAHAPKASSGTPKARTPKGCCAGDSLVVEAAAACIQAAATKHEANKCAFVDSGVAALLIAAARVPDQAPGALAAICGALRSFATADDARPSTSR